MKSDIWKQCDISPNFYSVKVITGKSIEHEQADVSILPSFQLGYADIF